MARASIVLLTEFAFSSIPSNHSVKNCAVVWNKTCRLLNELLGVAAILLLQADDNKCCINTALARGIVVHRRGKQCPGQQE